jgi:hypothetical protein
LRYAGKYNAFVDGTSVVAIEVIDVTVDVFNCVVLACNGDLSFLWRLRRYRAATMDSKTNAAADAAIATNV